MAPGSYSGNAEDPTGFFVVQSHKKPKMNDFGLLRVFELQSRNSLIQREQVLGRHVTLHLDVLKRSTARLPTVLQSLLSPRALNQDPPHRFRGSSEEVAAAVPVLPLSRPYESHIRLVD